MSILKQERENDLAHFDWTVKVTDRKGECSTLQGLLNLEVTAAQLVRSEGNCAPAGAGRD